MTTIGFVGLGDMGSQMVPHLVRAGHRVSVFDIKSERIAAMTALGAHAADSGAAAAHDADVVISAVMSADIPAAHFGPDTPSAPPPWATVLDEMCAAHPVPSRRRRAAL